MGEESEIAPLLRRNGIERMLAGQIGKRSGRSFGLRVDLIGLLGVAHQNVTHPDASGGELIPIFFVVRSDVLILDHHLRGEPSTELLENEPLPGLRDPPTNLRVLVDAPPHRLFVEQLPEYQALHELQLLCLAHALSHTRRQPPVGLGQLLLRDAAISEASSVGRVGSVRFGVRARGAHGRADQNHHRKEITQEHAPEILKMNAPCDYSTPLAHFPYCARRGHGSPSRPPDVLLFFSEDGWAYRITGNGGSERE